MPTVDQRAAVQAFVGEQRIRVSKRKVKPAWQSVELPDLGYGRLLAFDQTVTKTGWVSVAHSPAGFEVIDRGMCRQPPVPDLSGFEDTLTRATWLALAIQEVVTRLRPEAVVHEMPAVHGHRIESSLLAALGVRLAADHHRIKVAMVSGQTAKLLLTGNRGAEKGEVRNALVTLLGAQEGRWNLDQWDSLALAVTYLHGVPR